MKWDRRVGVGTYVGGSYGAVAVITSQTGWRYIFRWKMRGRPQDEESVEA
jgi:hypothetical protein